MQTPEQTWPASRLVRFALLFVAVLICGFGGWSYFTRIDGAVVASGQVQVQLNRQVVAHRDGGEVASVHVLEGDAVEADELLLSLSETDLANEIAVLDTQYFELLARHARLSAERDGQAQIAFDPELHEKALSHAQTARIVAGQENLFFARKKTASAEIEQLTKQRAQISEQIKGLEIQRKASGDQLASLQADLENQDQLLQRGLTQQRLVTELQREVISITADIGRIASEIAQAEVRKSEAELAILKISTDRREAAIAELRETAANLARLKEQRSGLFARRNRLEIRAPVAGIIYDLSVFGEGAVISPAEPVLFIIPQDRPLIISARVNPVHIDQVYPGQPVRLRFTTFDQRTTPELDGNLLRTSADAFVDEITGEGYYLATIELPEDQRQRLPEGASLIPGMPVEAFLSTGERSAIAYLTRPLRDYFIRAFREN